MDAVSQTLQVIKYWLLLDILTLVLFTSTDGNTEDPPVTTGTDRLDEFHSATEFHPPPEFQPVFAGQTAFVRVTTLLIEPYTMIKWDNHNSTAGDQYEGFMVDLMDRISQLVGFKYKMFPVADGRYGYRLPTGLWDGMIGELIQKEVDIAAAPLYITRHRLEVVDFTRPFLSVQATLLMRRPPTGRKSRITKVADLLRQSEIRYGTLDSGMIKRAFRTSNDSLDILLWRKMKQFNLNTKTNEEGIERIRKEKYAFILPSTIGDYISRRSPCDLVAMDRFLMNKAYGLATPKGSGLLPKINSALEHLHTSGFIDYIYDKWWIKKSECSGIKSSKMYSLNGASVLHVSPHKIFLTALLLLYLTA